MQKESKIRDPLILGNKTYHDITRDIARPVEGKANKYWWILFGLSKVPVLSTTKPLGATWYSHQTNVPHLEQK